MRKKNNKESSYLSRSPFERKKFSIPFLELKRKSNVMLRKRSCQYKTDKKGKKYKDPQIGSVVRFFEDPNTKLTEEQFVFVLFNLGYINSCKVNKLGAESKNSIDKLFNSLSTNKTVPLNKLIQFIELINTLNTNHFDFTFFKKEKADQCLKTFISPELKQKQTHHKSNFTFWMGSKNEKENVTTRSKANVKEKINRFKCDKKQLLFSATVNVNGKQKPLQIYKGDDIFQLVENFSQQHKLTTSKKQKLYKVLKVRVEELESIA